ncbi:FtsK/SpoIIIE domain-containing protein [Leifsonia sp. NPDC058248]|uniref:FtsK/SpoIIIE domain-containing protein n=1 Tax=Leifsonia sp. NPDC058248 TaxID=3346402 RepID=UPI0036D97CBA
MKLTITVATGPDEGRDVVVTADVTATVADIAERLAALPKRSAARTEQRAPGERPPLTLRVEFPGATQGRVLNPGAAVHESSLRSGCRVEVVPVGERRPGDERDDAPAALVRILAGPESGREFGVTSGVNLVGRDPSAAVFLPGDSEVSRRHATITVAETVTVADLNSANGVQVDGALVQRAIVRAASRVQVGGTQFQVVPLPVAAHGPRAQAAAGFSRSPRVEPAYRGETFTLPEIPVPPAPPRLPLLVLLSPLVLGAALFVLTQQVFTLLFVALSPLIMVGTWFDTRRQGSRKRKEARRAFDDGMEDARRRLGAERVREVAARRSESPQTAEITEAMRARTPLLWTRKPEHTTFLELRFGLGAQESRSSIRMPSKNGGDAADWTAAAELADAFAEVGPVPVVESFERAGAVGVAGVGMRAQDAARALVIQLAGLHSPADLAIVAFAAGDATETWTWLKWLPHVDSSYSPLRSNGLVADYQAASALLAELEGLIAARRSAGVGRERVRSRLDETRPLDDGHGSAVDRLPAVPAVLVIVTQEAPADRARLVALAEEGPDHGVFVLWLAPAVDALPVVCRTYVTVDAATARADVGFVRSGRNVALQTTELIDAVAAETAARALAPVEDSGARVLDETDLPHSVPFADLYEGDVMSDEAAVVQRWVKNDSLTRGWIPGTPRDAGGIRSVVGQGPSEPFALDLRAHGPHALVGGTTGSGKSEFLQSWIMGIAAEYSPDRVTFLLVDYKGGAAFSECVGLPHTVGLVTDLTPHLVRRALTSLRAELTHRETLLNLRGAKDLLTLEKRSDPDAPPALVIVVDEFAALAAEVPEFVDGVIDVAQRGRSLGLHLILATQRPSGVIKDSLRANTNLRVALRVADEADSADVLGVPDAARFDPGTPGRAAAKLGPGRVFDFQSAYLGGRTERAGADPDVQVQDLPFGPGQPWAMPGRELRVPQGSRDIERLADTIARAADARRVDVPRRPWLDQLPELIDLGALPPGEGGRIPIGVVDEPEAQRQGPYLLDLETVGNVAILGAGGAGKSALLRTIAAAASATAAEHPVTIHVVDFAGGALGMLETLPTVSSVVPGTDIERVTRMLADVTEAVAERSVAFADARAASLSEYRAVTGRALPRVIVLVDGFGAFRSDYEFRSAGSVFDRLLAMASTGRQLGVHVVLTADRSGALPTALTATIGSRLVLRLAGEAEYAAAGVPGDVLAGAPAGRGLADGHELQIAVPGGGPDLSVQAAAIDAVGGRLRSASVTPAKPIERLAAHIPAKGLPISVDGRPTLGVSDETLEPVGIPLDGLFVVTGPFGSGRTTAMTTAIRATLAVHPQLAPFLLVARGSALARACDWTELSRDADEAESLALRLATRLEARTAEGDASPLIVIENVGDFEGLPAESQVARLIKAARRAGVPVLAEADTVTAPGAWQLFAELKTARAGLVLQPEETDGLALFRTPFPRVTRGEFPVGRGILVDSGRLTRVQVAFLECEIEDDLS